MKHESKGFTLIEICVVISIILVLTSILLPVMSKAKRAAQESAAAQKIHQIWLAVSLYRSDYDGDGKYGDVVAMGLPYPGYTLQTLEHLALEPYGIKWNSGWIASCQNSRYGLIIPTWSEQLWWTIQAETYRENLIILEDFSCSDVGIDFTNEYQEHIGIGTLLSGQIVNHYKFGNASKPLWWAEPAP